MCAARNLFMMAKVISHHVIAMITQAEFLL
jgi:hypothetical protein